MKTTDQITCEENTQRLIARATKLGYEITRIADGEITIRSAGTHRYTADIQHTGGAWKIQTTAWGALDLNAIEEVTDAYQRAAAMVRALEADKPGSLAGYHA